MSLKEMVFMSVPEDETGIDEKTFTDYPMPDYEPRLNIGDSAVDGLVGGLVAGVAMGIYLMVVGLRSRISAWYLIETLVPLNNDNLVYTILLHLAISMIYGAVYGALISVIRRVSGLHFRNWFLIVFAGLYGLALFVFARVVLFSVIEQAFFSQNLLLHLFIAHVFYGFVLGLLVRQVRASEPYD